MEREDLLLVLVREAPRENVGVVLGVTVGDVVGEGDVPVSGSAEGAAVVLLVVVGSVSSLGSLPPTSSEGLGEMV